jgi:hypothetical protein
VKRGFVAFVLLVLATATPALFAQEAPVTGSATLGLFNRYIFRGYELGAENGVIQPSLAVTTRGFTLSFWGNIDVEEEATPSFEPDRPGHGSFNEADISLSYTRTVGRFEATAGWIYYGTRYATETQEVWLGVSYDTIGKPTLTVYRDVGSYPGTYINLSLSHSLAFGKSVSLDLGASAGYFAGSDDCWRTYDPNEGAYTGERYHDFHDGMLKAGLTIALAEGWSIQPMVQYFFPLSSTARRVSDGNSINPDGRLADTVVYGTTIVMSF